MAFKSNPHFRSGEDIFGHKNRPPEIIENILYVSTAHNLKTVLQVS